MSTVVLGRDYKGLKPTNQKPAACCLLIFKISGVTKT
jgi:hypothetical protein